MGLIPYALVWVVFLILYLYMPNTKVNFRSALFAAVVAGTAYQLIQWACISFQIGVTRYSSIYGGFAALPVIGPPSRETSAPWYRLFECQTPLLGYRFRRRVRDPPVAPPRGPAPRPISRM